MKWLVLSGLSLLALSLIAIGYDNYQMNQTITDLREFNQVLIDNVLTRIEELEAK